MRRATSCSSRRSRKPLTNAPPVAPSTPAVSSLSAGCPRDHPQATATRGLEGSPPAPPASVRGPHDLRIRAVTIGGEVRYPLTHNDAPSPVVTLVDPQAPR